MTGEYPQKNKDKKGSTPQCCVGCVVWQQFGKKCWYYWEGKKHCTMWTSGFNY